ncbi:TadE/TadG family type IV pilus assembly protein [Oribacterium sinus]
MMGKEENDKMKSNRNRVETSLDNPVETGFESYAENVAGHRLKELLLKERASVTLEAAIILPIFCFLFMALNGVFFVFSAQNQVMHALVQTANSLSLDPYWNEKTGVENPNVSNMLQNFERSITQDKSFSSTESWHKNETVSSGVLEDRFYSYFTGDGNKLSAYTKLKKLGVVGNMELSGTVNNGDLTLVAKYKMKFWFNLFKTEPLDLSQKVKVHLWGLEDY